MNPDEHSPKDAAVEPLAKPPKEAMSLGLRPPISTAPAAAGPGKDQASDDMDLYGYVNGKLLKQKRPKRLYCSLSKRFKNLCTWDGNFSIFKSIFTSTSGLARYLWIQWH